MPRSGTSSSPRATRIAPRNLFTFVTGEWPGLRQKAHAIIQEDEGLTLVVSTQDAVEVGAPETLAVNGAELETLPPAERRQAIDRIAQGLRQIALSTARYRCSNCGYSTQRFIWHCPSCKLWETVRPIQSLSLETVLT